MVQVVAQVLLVVLVFHQVAARVRQLPLEQCRLLLAVVDLSVAVAVLLEQQALVQVAQVVLAISMLVVLAQLELEHHSVAVEVALDIQAQVLTLLQTTAVQAVLVVAVGAVPLHLVLLAQAATVSSFYITRRKNDYKIRLHFNLLQHRIQRNTR
jgi:hypothetical protein